MIYRTVKGSNMDLLEFLTIFYKEYQDISWTLILESTARPFSVVQINLVVLIFEISSSITVLNYVSYDFCYFSTRFLRVLWWFMWHTLIIFKLSYLSQSTAIDQGPADDLVFLIKSIILKFWYKSENKFNFDRKLGVGLICNVYLITPAPTPTSEPCSSYRHPYSSTILVFSRKL